MNDLISRQDAIDSWDKLSKRGRTEFDQVLMILPSAYSPKAKLINAFADALTDEEIIRSEEYARGYVEGVKEGLAGKSKGKWVKSHTDGYVYCSNCNTMQDEFHAISHEWRFCPNCGARMEEGDE